MPELRDTTHCYVCGRDNPAGLRVDLMVDRERRTIAGRFTPLPEHEGWEGIVHGGIIAALLDEAMVKLASQLGMRAMSAEITIKFRAPAAPGEELAVSGMIVRDAGRLVEAEAAVARGDTIVAEATGKLLRT